MELEERATYYENGELKQRYFVDKNNQWQGSYQNYYNNGTYFLGCAKNNNTNGIGKSYENNKLYMISTFLDTSFNENGVRLTLNY